MKIGIVVDGDSEVDSLPLLFDAIRQATQHQFLAVEVARVPPDAPLNRLVRVVASKVQYLEARGADRVIVMMEREQQAGCPGAIAEALATQLQTVRAWECELAVVIKDRMYENWLVADLEALRLQRKRFRVSKAIEQRVAPDLADQADGMAILQACVIRHEYRKRPDSVQIMRHADPLRIAANSRSFRRFLRGLGHLDYADQSRRPNPRR